MKEITHEGIIERIEGEKVFVRVMQESACAGCHAKGVCSSTDTKDHIIESYSNHNFKVGDSALVSGSNSQGLKAVFWAYVMPFLLVLFVLIIGELWIHDEAISGILAIGILVPYFVLLKLFRKSFESNYVFRATPLR